MKSISKLFLAAIGLILFSCSQDDSTTTVNVNPLSEQVIVDSDALVKFLESHYYNEEEFDNAANITDFSYDIKFYVDETIAGIDANGDGDMLDTNQTVTGYDSNGDGVIDGSDIDNTTVFTRTRLIDLVETKVITLTDTNNNDEQVDHTMYILKVNQGGGAKRPRFCDEAVLNYEGQNLELTTFDSTVSPNDWDLTTLVRGFYEGVSEFNVASSYIYNGDGTYTYSDYGIGAVFFPSALGYYASPVGTDVSSYSPLIFKLKVFATSQLDHDGDGVPTFLEDIDDDRYVQNDNTDGDGFADYGDLDDDGDTVPTREEVVIDENEYDTEGDIPSFIAPTYEIDRRINETNGKYVVTTVTLQDTDGDGIFDYLDTDDDNDGTDTINEDADGDGQVTDDDTDGDTIPDYLDTDN